MPTPRKYTDHAARQRAYRQRQAQARLQEIREKGLPPAPPIPTMPGTARWQALLDRASNEVATTLSEMQDYYDDRSEQWQESEKGDAMQNAIEGLELILDALTQFTMS